MMGKLSERDKRALKFGIVCVVGIVAFLLITTWLEKWSEVRSELAFAKAELKEISPSKAKREGLLSIVPVFEMPEVEHEQKICFREKLNEQLKKAGIKCKPLKFLPVSRSKKKSGYRLLRLKCSGKGKFGQVLDLLADLKSNPYFVAIEEIKIKCDEKKRQEVELDLTVSTFIK